jgi:hypothetical protein
MKTIVILTGLFCLLISQTGQAQPADLVLSSPESGTVVHQATNSITFAPGYSYTPNGGTMTAEIVSAQLLSRNRVCPLAISSASSPVKNTLILMKIQGDLFAQGNALCSISLKNTMWVKSLQSGLSLDDMIIPPMFLVQVGRTAGFR